MITQEQLDKYRWYHSFQFGGAKTKATNDCSDIWAHIAQHMKPNYFSGKDVLDCGSRDCYWSFEAEKMGASSITAIDISVSRAVDELLIPELKSKIVQRQLNVMDVRKLGMQFDTILCLGLLYHLRYPFAALKALSDVLKIGGKMIIETAVWIRKDMEHLSVLWCPVDESPYEKTSCTFFNMKGLIVTAKSFGLNVDMQSRQCRRMDNPHGIDRAVCVFTKVMPDNEFLETYWNGVASLEELQKLHGARV